MESFVTQELMLWALYGLSVIGLLIFAKAHIKRVYALKWYDTSLKGPNKEVSWEQIIEWCCHDPMPFSPEGGHKWRFPHGWIIRDIIIAVPITVFLIGVGEWILRKGSSLSIAEIKDFAVIVAGGGVFLSAFGLFYKGRISTRAVNRQAWINELRAEINQIIADIPFWNALPEKRLLALKKLNKRHTKIELYLNPSERVHRTFMTLVRFMYDAHDVEVDRKIRCILGLPDKAPRNEEEWKHRKSQIIRLANVLLKREWEQVKLIA